MPQCSNAWLEHQRRRFMRPDAHRWVRPDAHRWFRPDAERWLRPDDEDWPLLESRIQRSHGNPRGIAAATTRSVDLDYAARVEAAHLRCELAAEDVLVKARRLAELLRKYRPDQPRVPSGSPEGGQWTSEGEPKPIRLAAADRTPLGRATRIALALELAKRLIDTFRKDNLLFDLFGNKVGTVAITSLDDKYVYGFNSGISEFSGQYTANDEAAANELRDRMLETHPDTMRRENIGRKPNDSIYHAETTVLLRAALENGGTLEGKDLRVFVDGPMCWSCRRLLPLVGLELGNPTVTFVGPRGATRTMRDGRWLDRRPR